MGLIFTFTACSDSTSSPSAPSADNKEPITSVNSSGDTVIIHQTVFDSLGNEITYYSEGVFCWTDECDKAYNSSSSKAPEKTSSSSVKGSSSSAAPKSSSSQSLVVTPTLDLKSGTLTDNRDKNVYKVEEYNGLLWMAENLRYKRNTSYYCPTYTDDEDVERSACEDFGGYYNYSEANSSCPSGWRLPTTAEMLAVDRLVEQEWWTIGGRYDLDNNVFGQVGDQGWLWAKQESSGKNAWQIKNYGEDNEHAFTTGKLNGRAYNVRCVSAKK